MSGVWVQRTLLRPRSCCEFRSSHDRSRGGTPTPRGGCPLGNLMVSDLLANQRGIGQMPGAGSAVRGGACQEKSNQMLGRSEERRVGKGCVSTCKKRLSAEH